MELHIHSVQEQFIPVNAVSGGERIDPLKHMETAEGGSTLTNTRDTALDLLIDRWPLND